MVGLAKTEKDLTVSGSFDHIAPIEEMRSVDEAMRLYFKAEDWLRQRNEDVPGLAKTL